MLYIREAREEKGLTQEELAKMVGIGRVTLSRYETEERSIKVGTLVAIADALNVPIDYLVRGKEKEPPQTERLEGEAVDAISQSPPDQQKIALSRPTISTRRMRRSYGRAWTAARISSFVMLFTPFDFRVSH